MRRFSIIALVGLFLATGLGAAQEGKKVKGTLPAGYGKLGLSDEQKQNIYKVQAEYDAQIDRLEAQLKKLKSERKGAIDRVLTADQKRQLRAQLEERLPGEEGKKPVKP